MLTAIRLVNFKAFEKCAIQLRPLTIFLGPNNSGKSSILAALRLLGQSAESYDPTPAILLKGIYGDFGTFADVVHGNVRNRSLGIGIDVITDRPRDDTDAQKSSRLTSLDMEFKYRARRRQVVLENAALSVNGERILKIKYSEKSDRYFIDQIDRYSFPQKLKRAVPNILYLQNFIPRPRPPSVGSQTTPSLTDKWIHSKKLENVLQRARRGASDVSMQLHRLDYLGPLRAAPQRTYPFSGERRQHVGQFGEHAVDIFLSEFYRAGGTRTADDRTNEWFRKASVAKEIKIVPISDRYFELKVTHAATGEEENLADVGYGHSQIFPVLVGGFNCRPGSCFIVEQPEIHLHPRAQTHLARFFSDLLQTGIQSLVETHSEHLIIGVQELVASGILKPRDVALYYVFTKGRKKTITLVELDEGARFTREWPEGFFLERLKQAKRLALTRAKKNL